MGKSIYAVLLLVVITLPSPAGAGSADTLFDILNDEIVCSGPPYPTVAYEVALGHRALESPELDGGLHFGIADASDGLDRNISLVLNASEAPPPAGDFSTASHFDVFYCDGADGQVYPGRSHIGAFMRLLSDNGSPADLTILRPELSVSDQLRFFLVALDGSSFRITCRTEFVQSVGHELVLRGKLADGLELTGLNIALAGGSSPARYSSHMVGGVFFTDRAEAIFDIGVSILKSSEIDTSQPVLSLELAGQFLGAPSPVEDATWGAIKAVFLD